MDMATAADGAFDYQGWVRRALRFMDRVALVDGVEIQSRAAEAPAAVEQRGARALPPALAEFLRSGAASLDCLFVYEPDDEAFEELSALFPDEGTLYGGARLSSAREMADAAQSAREWVQGDSWDEAPAEQRELWEHAQPFTLIDNGDYLALDLRTGAADPPVLYLNHDDESFTLAPSFTAFLTA
jgi:SMI1 / KNR4 family (SUKH-1)